MASNGPDGRKKDGSDRYSSLRTRSHWKAEDAARVLDDWLRSGLKMAAFAREHGLGLHRLRWWQAQLSARKAPPTVHLVPVTPRQAPLVALGSTAGAALVVDVEGVRIEVSNSREADPRWVAALVLGLRGGRT
jgi:transposase-like protein